MKQKDNISKFKAVDLHNGIIVNIVDGRDGKIVEINISGQKKKLPPEEVDALIDALISAKQWFNDTKLWNKG
jgi:hypothetical protein